MSNFMDSQQSNSKSSNSISAKEMEEYTTLKSSGYQSTSDSETSKGNNSTGNSVENKSQKETKKRTVAKGKMISSRYQQAALSATSRMRSSSVCLQQTFSQADLTGRISDVKNISPLRPTPRSPVSASCTEIHKCGKLSVPAAESTKREASSQFSMNKRPTGLQTPNMHSTAVNATLLDSTRSCAKTLSTTVVRPPPKRRAQAYMPDFSAIQPFSEENLSTAPTSSQAESVSFDSVDEHCEISQADLDLEYLRYLTWAFIDSSSDDAFQHQCADAEGQMSFLMQIIKEKRQKIAEHKKHLRLIKLHSQIVHHHRQLKEVLSKFAEVSPNCQMAVQEIGSALQPKIDSVKLKNIYCPEAGELYTEELKNALQDTGEILTKVVANIATRHSNLTLLNEAANCLKQKKNVVSLCKKKAERVAESAIQEASLNFTVKDLEIASK